jgi:hypothetical protein
VKTHLAEHLAALVHTDARKLQTLLREGSIPPGTLPEVHARLCDSCQLLALSGLPTASCGRIYQDLDAITHEFAIAIQVREIGA